jgi:hypothetical protein
MHARIFVVVALVVSLPAPARPAEVTATRLDGSTVTGALERWTGSELAVATTDAIQSIALKDLLSVRWHDAPLPRTAEDARARPVVELIDGSIIPIEQFQVAGGKATLSPAARVRDQKLLTVDVRHVAAVRFRELSADAVRQWQEIRALNLPSDVLVVMKREGRSLDYAEGVVGDVSADTIEVKLEDEPVSLDRARAAGIIYYRRNRGTPSNPQCVVTGDGGLRLVAAEAAAEGDTLRVKTPAGVELSWPLDEIHLADFSAGKLVYLSDLEPLSEAWAPLVGLPPGASIAAAYGKMRRDQSAFGRSLSLIIGETASGQPGQERAYAKGLAIRSRSEVVYRLPEGYRRFAAIAGIDPATSGVGNVALTIRGDDRVLFETVIAGDQPPVPIDLDVRGVRRLTILIDYGRNLDHGDWLNLCDARLVK